MDNNLISWGIIGCGDVTEVKSGPAFNKVNHSKLAAVMRRDGAKAKDFAARHGVPLWYDNAEEILANESINAIYIATPPSTHLMYALEALSAGKDVYLEKPMVLSAAEAVQLEAAVKSSNQKLVVAHYRRALPMYAHVKSLLEKHAIGAIKFVDLKFLKAKDPDAASNWRLNPKISGGGLFHDLAPHQLDMMYYFFGDYSSAIGYSSNQEDDSEASDIVNGVIHFENGVHFRGIWNFSIPANLETDDCTIYGSEGTISFSFYGNDVTINTLNQKEQLSFENPINIQQPFIEKTVDYFLNKGNNPCDVSEGMTIITLMDLFTKSNDPI